MPLELDKGDYMEEEKKVVESTISPEELIEGFRTARAETSEDIPEYEGDMPEDLAKLIGKLNVLKEQLSGFGDLEEERNPSISYEKAMNILDITGQIANQTTTISTSIHAISPEAMDIFNRIHAIHLRILNIVEG